MTRLALVMIVRNEERCLRRCLESARPHVDDIIVLDTGSADATVAIAREMGARVGHFTWCDDFSAARNAALAMSDAAWNLVLDADEWIEQDNWQFAERSDTPSAFIGLIQVASWIDTHGGKDINLGWVPRLLPRGVRYQGRIHEQPASDLPRRRLPLKINHDGYLRQQLETKRERNGALLRAALAESPNDPYLLYQNGKNHEVYEDYPAAVHYYKQALAYVAADAGIRHDLVVRALFSMKKTGSLEEAIQLADDEMPNWQESPDFFFALGDVFLDWAARHPEKALAEILPTVEACWKKCLEIGDRPVLSGTVIGRGSHLAARNLVVLYESLGLHAEADKYRALALRASPAS